ncbi:MAG: serine/threonine protein kinase [Oscillochloridaceae bacterium]|nr:serine/threonine protein kinase [Chloroflexaceae bacterium]MDW8388661.1 serine/threonine protein kinase [Oscillochloridaceae bacterium]
MTIQPGVTLNQRYTIRRAISEQGGFGATYLATDAVERREVVIKVSKTAGDIEQNALLRELQLLKSLEHPRLPRVYDGFFHQGQLCVAMQYIPGRDVSSYVVPRGPDRRADPPDRPTALRWISQTLEALAYLHERGIVHRDVKPSNLRVHMETGEIFLLDFGLSQSLAQTAIRAHSPRFSPPEQYDPDADPTPASDVYSVGATLYLLLTGYEPPFRDDHNDRTVRLPSEESQSIPIELEHVVLKAMSYDPADRFPDAQAMLDELRRLGYAWPPAQQPVTASMSTTFLAPTQPAAADASADDPLPRGGTAMLPIGQTIKERYQIRELLSARGGFGTTYRAFDVERGQEVVIKASKTADDSKQDALLEERELLRQLSHERLPKVYDAFFFDGQLCISMEYIRGRDVASYLRQGPPDLPTALRWMRQLLEALTYLHGREIVHCDVKPENLRVHHLSGELYLLDFGISRRHNRLVVRGYTRHFSAPEQRRPGAPITPAADVYAAGAVLYNLLVGEPPPDRAPDESKPILLPAATPVPPNLERIVLKALMPNPADRYPNARAMLEDLRRVRLPVRSFTPARTVWAGLTVVLAVGLGLAIANLTRLSAGSPSPAPTAATASVAATLPAAVTEGPVAIPNPTPEEPAPPTVPAPTPTLGTPTPASSVSTATPPEPVETPTATPPPFVVSRFEIPDQGDRDFVFVGRLPLQFVLIGERLTGIRTVTLQPAPASDNRPAIGLIVQRAEPGRLDLRLNRLPDGFRSGQYDLLLNGLPAGVTLRLQDYLRESRILGIKYDYRHLAAIRPLPSYRFQGQDIPGPFGLLCLRPDESSRGSYLRNGDLLEILDTTSYPGWYRVRVKENFDPNLIGYEGWVLAWVVEDTPPDPPAPGAIQVSWNIRGEKVENVIEDLAQRGIPRENIIVDLQDRERIPEVFDRYKANQVVSSEPPEGGWVLPGARVVLGVRAP